MAALYSPGMRRISFSLSIIILCLSFLLCLSFSSTGSAQSKSPQSTLLSHKDGKISISVRNVTIEKEPSIELVIKSAGLKSSAVFSLKDPPRLVLDLNGAHAASNRVFSLGNDQTISGMRLGVHSDKIRIVVDLKSATIPDYSWSEKRGAATLTIRRTHSAAHKDTTVGKKTALDPKSIAPVDTPAPSPTKVAAHKVTPPKPLVVRKIDSLPEEEPTPEPTPTPRETSPLKTETSPQAVVDNTARPIPGSGQAITGIRFDYDNSVPVLKILLRQRVQFELIRREDGIYKIIVADSTLADSTLSLVQFPPHDFMGFTMVQAGNRPEGGSIVTIGVERGVKISATPADNEIWVRVSGGL